MAVAVDGSTPARVTSATQGSFATASFTAPSDALLVAILGVNTTSATVDNMSIADSGGLSWTPRVARTSLETVAGACTHLWTARTVSSVSRTVTFTNAVTSGDSDRASGKVYVLTGADVDGTPVDTPGANHEGGSTTNNLTTSSVTPGADGLLIVGDTDWSAAGVFESSSDLTQDTATYAEISVCTGYKTCSSGVGVTANLNAAGTGAVQHKWVQIVVRAAAAGGTSIPIAQGTPIVTGLSLRMGFTVNMPGEL